jgi:CheY-like chemotaxis protein
LNKERINIFLADDDEDDRELFRDALEKITADYELTTFNNGGQALNHCAGMTGEPNFLFLDINMPLVDGYECLQTLRKNGFTFPVIMLSTSNSETLMEKCYRAGANFCIQKPPRFSQLIKMLRFCLFDLNTLEKRDQLLNSENIINIEG